MEHHTSPSVEEALQLVRSDKHLQENMSTTLSAALPLLHFFYQWRVATVLSMGGSAALLLCTSMLLVKRSWQFSFLVWSRRTGPQKPVSVCYVPTAVATAVPLLFLLRHGTTTVVFLRCLDSYHGGLQ